MKYLVMECHEAYAVLMDEDSRFVNAANMHYEVGQVVTDPVLMEDEKRSPLISRRFIVRTVAAAACIAIVGYAGIHFFMKAPEEPHTVVLVSAAADIRMELDSKGSVISITSDTEKGREMISKFKETHKVDDDRLDLASDILEFQIENGYISSGDKVEVLIPADTKNYSTYKEEFETEISRHDLTPEVKEIKGEPPHEPPEPPAPAATAPSPEQVKPQTKAEEKREAARNTTAVQPPAAPDIQKPSEAPGVEHKAPDKTPEPSAPAVVPPAGRHEDVKPETPAPSAPGAGNAGEEPPKPAEPGNGRGAEKPEPPADPHSNERQRQNGQVEKQAAQKNDEPEIPKPH